MKNILLAGAAALIFASCQQAATPETSEPEVAAPEAEAAETTVKTSEKMAGAEDIGNRVEVMMAIQSLDRPEADLEDDEIRKAAAVLEFTGVWPGMTVVELEAGSGYYTELFSRIVGKDGKVYMQNPHGFDKFITAEVFAARLGENGERLANVTHMRGLFDNLDVATGSADMVTWVLGPHEMFCEPKDCGELGGVDGAYAEIARVLKPGGKFIALDHVAIGDDEAVGGTLHRIQPDKVKQRAEAVGLVFVKAGKILHNTTDDHTKSVFNPEVRRKTDRFLHMYVKPKK